MTEQGPVIEGLDCRSLDIQDIKIFRSARSTDERGFVQPTYNSAYFESIGITTSFVHENHCFSPHPYTIRGFHYQLPPYGQPKLVRVTRGRILDVNIDLRAGSPTFGEHVKIELTPDGWFHIYVPSGFAHCYATLEPDTEVIFKLGSLFAPSHARGLAWNDPDLGIQWPFDEKDGIVLQRDLDRPKFSTVSELFPFPAD